MFSVLTTYICVYIYIYIYIYKEREREREREILDITPLSSDTTILPNEMNLKIWLNKRSGDGLTKYSKNRHYIKEAEVLESEIDFWKCRKVGFGDVLRGSKP
jgi:hypothetical protein